MRFDTGSRVVYVIPFTLIIEQAAEVFREALNTHDNVLEHHASFDWERAAEARGDDGEGPDGLAKLRRAAENWDVPIVVTTAVQFFESLFAARTSRCRKLHNLAGSVIVLDEAQTLPIPLLRPCMAALQELSANYSASVVLCTATALRKQDGFTNGFPIDDSRGDVSQPRADDTDGIGALGQVFGDGRVLTHPHDPDVEGMILGEYALGVARDDDRQSEPFGEGARLAGRTTRAVAQEKQGAAGAAQAVGRPPARRRVRSREGAFTQNQVQRNRGGRPTSRGMPM